MFFLKQALFVTLSTFLTFTALAQGRFVKSHSQIAQVKDLKCNDLPVVEGEERRLLKCVVAPIGSQAFRENPYEIIIEVIEESARLSVVFNGVDYREEQFREGVETVGTMSEPRNIQSNIFHAFSRGIVFNAEYRQALGANGMNQPHALIIKKYFETIRSHRVESREVFLVFRLNKEKSCYLGFVDEINTARKLADNLEMNCKN